MSNQILLLLIALCEVFFILLASRRGLEWLYGTILINLILVGIFGSKLIMVGGYITNAGNVFYGCVFLATHFILEHKGKRDGTRTILYGAFFAALFAVLASISTRIVGLPATDAVSSATLTLFTLSVRVTIASLVAFVFAQYVNIHIYEWLKVKTRGKHMWFRMNAASIVGQLVDSLIFFTIAFTDLPGPIIIETIAAGWVIKVLVVALGTPFLYLDLYLREKK